MNSLGSKDLGSRSGSVPVNSNGVQRGPLPGSFLIFQGSCRVRYNSYVVASPQEYRQIRLQDIPSSSLSFVCRELANVLRGSLAMSQYYHEHFDWSKNPKEQMVYDLLRNPPSNRTQHVLLRGSVGSGKTTGAIAWAFENCLDKYPGSKWLVMRRTNMQLMASVNESIRDFNRDFSIPATYKISKSSGPPEVTYPNGSKFVFWSSESAVESTTTDTARGLGGTQYSGCTLEEADMIHVEAVDTIPQRLREKSGIPVRVIFYVANPTPESHWLYKRFSVKNKAEIQNPDYHPEDYHEFHFTLEDNRYWSRPGYIEEMYSTYRHRPSLFRRMILGEWGPEIKGDPFYGPYFNRDFHIAKTSFIERWHRDQLYNDGPVCLCWDFGFRRPALVVFQDAEVGSFRQIRILAGFLGDSITLGVWGKFILDQVYQMLPEAEFETYVDPAGLQVDGRGVTAENAVDVLRSLGLNPKWKREDESYGIDLTIDLLKGAQNNRILGMQPSIVFEPTRDYTGDLVDMFEIGYCQDPNSKDGKTKPYEDNYYIHYADAWRYGIIWRRHIAKGKNTIGPQNRERNNYRSIREIRPGIYVPIPEEEMLGGHPTADAYYEL